MVLVSTGSERELNRGSTRQSSSGLRQSKNRPRTGAAPDLGTAKSAGNHGPEARQDKDRAHGFQQVMRQMNQRFGSLKLETGSVRKAQHKFARHVWADSDTVSQRQSLPELDADRSAGTHTRFAKAIGARTMVGPEMKGQCRRFYNRLGCQSGLGGAASETPRILKPNSRIRATGDPAGHRASGRQGAASGARKTKVAEQVNSVPARHGPRARAGRCVLGCVVKGQRRVSSGP